MLVSLNRKIKIDSARWSEASISKGLSLCEIVWRNRPCSFGSFRFTPCLLQLVLPGNKGGYMITDAAISPPRRKGKSKGQGSEVDPLKKHKRGLPLLGVLLGVYRQRLSAVSFDTAGIFRSGRAQGHLRLSTC